MNLGTMPFMVKTEHGSENVFNIAQPGRYRCQILHYHRKLSRLYLSVYQEQRRRPAFYILFSDVAYIDAPMTWTSADFSIAEKQAGLKLMIQAGLVGEAIRQFPAAYAPITDYARLYRVRTTHGEVRIIASSGTMMRHIPDGIQ